MRAFLVIPTLCLALVSPAHGADSVTLSFGGDVNGEYPISKTLSLGGNPLGDASAIFKKSDISAVNLETVVSTLGTAADKEFTFAAPFSLLPALKHGGVSVVNVANNHSFDYGQEAFVGTLKNISDSKLVAIGGGVNYKDAWSPRIVKVRGMKVAFIGVGKINGGKESIASYKSPGITSNWDQKGVLASIAAAKAITPIVIAMVHWGVEKAHCAGSTEKKSAALWIKAGATAIIGSHPHVQQAIVSDKGSTVAYSLGNLSFYSSHGDSGRSGVLTLRVSDAGKVVQSVFTPMHIDPKTGSPKLLSPSDSANELAAIASYGLPTCVDASPSSVK